MPKFEVNATIMVRESIYFIVEADSKEEAEKIAQEQWDHRFENPIDYAVQDSADESFNIDFTENIDLDD